MTISSQINLLCPEAFYHKCRFLLKTLVDVHSVFLAQGIFDCSSHVRVRRCLLSNDFVSGQCLRQILWFKNEFSFLSKQPQRYINYAEINVESKLVLICVVLSKEHVTDIGHIGLGVHTGTDTWCKFQKDKASGTGTYKHGPGPPTAVVTVYQNLAMSLLHNQSWVFTIRSSVLT